MKRQALFQEIQGSFTGNVGPFYGKRRALFCRKRRALLQETKGSFAGYPLLPIGVYTGTQISELHTYASITYIHTHLYMRTHISAYWQSYVYTYSDVYTSYLNYLHTYMCVHTFLPTGEYMCTHIPICTHILRYYARLHHRPFKFVSGHGVGEFV